LFSLPRRRLTSSAPIAKAITSRRYSPPLLLSSTGDYLAGRQPAAEEKNDAILLPALTELSAEETDPGDLAQSGKSNLDSACQTSTVFIYGIEVEITGREENENSHFLNRNHMPYRFPF
jgi:hypothetical protein